MIVVDSSRLLAILLDEAEKQAFESVLTGAERLIISAFNAHEAACVMRGKHGPAGVARLWDLLAAAEIEIVPFDDVQVRAAAAAFDRYGKGLHKAHLNMADRAAYALAKTMNVPLLFKGNDFPQTDIRSAIQLVALRLTDSSLVMATIRRQPPVGIRSVYVADCDRNETVTRNNPRVPFDKLDLLDRLRKIVCDFLQMIKDDSEHSDALIFRRHHCLRI